MIEGKHPRTVSYLQGKKTDFFSDEGEIKL